MFFKNKFFRNLALLLGKMESLIFATERNKDNNCLTLCYRIFLPFSRAIKNRKKMHFFRQTRAQFALSFSYLE